VIPKYRTLILDAPTLVTWGPYALVRNPLYVGNALLGCGWAVMVGWSWVGAFAAVYYAMYSLVIIPDEECFLTEKFKDEYLNYKIVTHALIPNFTNFRELAFRIKKNRGRFDAGKSWSMECHSLRMNALVTVLVLVRLFALDY
jgi:hypothetical protein